VSLALLVLGTVAVVDLTDWRVPAAGYFGAALGVVGLGLVIGAWYGRARWLIALGIVLSIGLGIAGSVDWVDGRWHGNTVTWEPTSVGAVQSEYRHEFGDTRLDLTEIDFSNQATPVRTDVQVDVGNLEIIVPPNVDVTVDAKVDVGNLDVFGETWGGLDPGARTVTNTGADGPGGGTLIIDARVDLGNLEVHR